MDVRPSILITITNTFKSGNPQENTKTHKNGTFICKCHFFCVPLRPQNKSGKMDSSFIISPVSADFSDVWSEPELMSAKGHNALYVATRFGRKYVLKALAEPYRESTPHIELLRKENRV